MPEQQPRIEIFSAPGCGRCGRALQLAQQVLAELAQEALVPHASLRLVNVVEELDYAVSLGLRATPGIAIDGVLVFTALPDRTALREAILGRGGAGAETPA